MTVVTKKFPSILDVFQPKRIMEPPIATTVNLMSEPKRSSDAELKRAKRSYAKHADKRRAARKRRYLETGK